MTTYTDHDTDYRDIKTYRMEKRPEQVRSETLGLLDDGADIRTIRACLMRSAWIDAGVTMQDRMVMRDQERREDDAFLRGEEAAQ